MGKLVLRTFVAVAALTGALTARADMNAGIFVGNAPPPLPYYDQPALPGDGYLWMPGYWAWDSYDEDYFWVPGTWVLPPERGYLWTPGYWGWNDSYYRWNPGYWSPHVGFYGGVNYGYGYTGSGYHGGYWRDRRFHYNRAVNNVRVVNVSQVNVYNEAVVDDMRANRVSYNGGNGGVRARPSSEEERAQHDQRIAATQIQTQHERAAVKDRALRASVNRGKPTIAATARPSEFSGDGVVTAGERATVKAGERDARRAGKPSASTPDRETRTEREAPESGAPVAAEENRDHEQSTERAREHAEATPQRDMREREVRRPPRPISEQRTRSEVAPGSARQEREIRQERRERAPAQRPQSDVGPGERAARPRKPDDAQPPR